MAKKKKLLKIIKLQIPAGKATPAPPIGPALGAAGLNIMGFCKEFNAKTQDKVGDVLPVEIFVYADKSFDFITKQPPMAKLIMKSMKLEKGSGVPNRDKVGKITRSQMEEIVKVKMPDLNCDTVESALHVVAGTCRSMGVDVDWS